MTQFTSGTQALQGRTVNHDPKPFVCTLAHCQAPQPHRLDFKGIGVRYEPRSEFDVLDNTLLRDFREDATQWRMDSGNVCTVADAARETLSWRDDSEADFPLTPEEVHLRRVLSLILTVFGEENEDV